MAEHSDHKEHHGPEYYVKIWALLLLLLVVSIVGPMFGHRVLTLVTAFGIAVVKALIVAGIFMHLREEKKYIWYVLLTMGLMVFLFFLGTAADGMKTDGNNWSNEAAHHLIQEHANSKASGEGHHP
ncbi:MAG: cytochrome C oxidase subunit IV family protein [Proteobacteria bacterium]|nr:cytochrome C oxidase subunit IV family protein [Pseudomonadota bacterium]